MALVVQVTNQPKDWINIGEGCIAKSSFGEIWTVTLSEHGKVHDRPLFIDRGGTIVIIVDLKGNVALERVYRPVCKRGEHLSFPVCPDDLERLESLEYEFPRGYAELLENATETGLREANEETGLQKDDVVTIVNLGDSFLNGFNPQPNNHIVLIVDFKTRLNLPLKAIKEEAIETVEWVAEEKIFELVANGDLRDAQSLAVWAKYQAKKKLFPDLFK